MIPLSTFQSKLPAAWKTERLQLQDAVIEEAAELQALYEACSYIGEWDGEFDPNPHHLMKCITDPHLPPGGERERFRIQTIREQSTGSIVGFLAVYQGEPTPDSLYIYQFYIHPDYQKRRFGQEIFHPFFDLARKAGFAKITLCVALKNFPAVRFWTRLGVDRIIKVHGDLVCSETTHSSMDLQMLL